MLQVVLLSGADRWRPCCCWVGDSCVVGLPLLVVMHSGLVVWGVEAGLGDVVGR